MSTSAIRNLVIAGVLGLVALIVFSSYVSAANYGNRMEVQLNAKVEDNENVYANGTQKIIEIAQVPKMYEDGLARVAKAAIGGRYGEGGSKAVFQFIKEQNPNIDPAMYSKIQQVIESFRDEFKNSQTQMLDIRRSYETALGSVWQGFWLKLAGYPKTDLSKFSIVTTDTAHEAFRTHRDRGIKLGE